MRSRRIAAFLAAAVVLANAAVIVALWAAALDARDLASVLTAAGRLAGLLGALLALVTVLALARLPVLDRLAGFDRITAWHRRAGTACLVLLITHAVLVTAGYTVGDRISLPGEAVRLVSGYPGVITAVAALALLTGVAATSVAAARRRLRYETWHFLHLYAYLAIALAFAHQIATGSDFVGRPWARAYWIGVYVATLGAVAGFRVVAPLARSLFHGLRVSRVVEEVPGVVSVEIAGRRLGTLKAQAGQFFTWRFLTRDRWWEAHPFSLSAAPDGRRLRITVKGVGDYTAALRAMPPGTRVVAEGPFGTFTAAARRRPRVALIAGGVGITPIRALLEAMPGAPGDIAVVYRARRPEDLILRDELDELAARRGADVHYVLGERDAKLLSTAHLETLVPDIAERDVYVCGPASMTDAARASLGPHVVAERFAY